jgi:hypothetical protein
MFAYLLATKYFMEISCGLSKKNRSIFSLINVHGDAICRAAVNRRQQCALISTDFATTPNFGKNFFSLC